jgi:hypothetical protein
LNRAETGYILAIGLFAIIQVCFVLILVLLLHEEDTIAVFTLVKLATTDRAVAVFLADDDIGFAVYLLGLLDEGYDSGGHGPMMGTVVG